MKQLAFGLCALVVVGSAAYAGTEHYSGKEMKQTTQQAAASCPQWYADNEWNVNLWGTYAFTGNTWPEDRYLDVDHAWGGGIDAKFFFARYFGLGVEGYILDAHNTTGQRQFNTFRNDNNNDSRRAIGSVLGTFTLRYPIPCTRFAPYVWAGGGGIFGGGVSSETVIDPTTGDAFRQDLRASNSKLTGQLGGGIEVRITPHIGIVNDFSWNVVDGSHNNFGMARSGISFAF